MYVRPATLYSTLGWFDDPLPRNLLAWREEDLIDVAVHEQVHATVYVPSDVTYDESLASFIAHQATLAQLADRPELAARARDAFADELTYASLVNALRRRSSRRPTPRRAGPDDARARRAPIFARYQQEVYPAQPWRTQRFARFQTLELSNAWLVANRNYLGLLPCFERELAALGGDLPAFVRAHRDAPGHRAPRLRGRAVSRAFVVPRPRRHPDRGPRATPTSSPTTRRSPGAYEAVRALRAAGFGTAIVTNQSGIARGRFGEADFARFQAHLLADFAAHGAALDASYHCPHLPDAGCECRKPRPGSCCARSASSAPTSRGAG